MKTAKYEYRIVSDGDGCAVAYRRRSEIEVQAASWVVEDRRHHLPDEVSNSPEVIDLYY